MPKILLFDIDGTLVESGQNITKEMALTLNTLKNKYEIGIVGGGKLDKILQQFNTEIYFNHYFSECGTVYHINENNNLIKIYEKNIRNHKHYGHINKLIKYALNYISNVSYTITGQFISLRTGIIYISLIGLDTNEEERKIFMEQDLVNNYRNNLLSELKNELVNLNIENEIDIVLGGSVGIAIYPSEYDKIQILEIIKKDDYEEIHYFGDKYLKDGNDYKLLNDKNVIGHKINKIEDTLYILNKLNQI
jgi:phosphomannomutase